MVKLPRLNTASIFGFLPFAFPNLFLPSKAPRVISEFSSFAVSYQWSAVPNYRFFTGGQESSSELSPLHFQFHQSPPVFPACSCFCPSFCFTVIINSGVPFFWWGFSYCSKLTPDARLQRHNLSSFCARRLSYLDCSSTAADPDAKSGILLLC